MTDQKRIDGKTIANKILTDITAAIAELKKTKKVTPYLKVILIGDNPASLSYIAQKKKTGEAVGAHVEVTELPQTTTKTALERIIKEANADPHIHGIIIQRPLPVEANQLLPVLDKVTPKKDVDGFVPNSPFAAPLAHAVIAVLEDIFLRHFDTPMNDFVVWLRSHTIVIVGKGETAGKPVAKLLETFSVPFMVVDRSTPQPEEIMKRATILISCVGQPRFIKKTSLSEGVILLSVGVTRMDGKLAGDYDEDEISKKVSFYTPTPGGVGPINVACLMQNLIKACKLQI